MVYYYLRIIILILVALLVSEGVLISSEREGPQRPTLEQAETCESIRDGLPVWPGRVFSVGNSRVYCVSTFSNIQRQYIVYHRWYHRDKLTATFRLKLMPPKYSTASSVQLRDNDKGAWKVEVVDEDGFVFKTIRFSVVE